MDSEFRKKKESLIEFELTDKEHDVMNDDGFGCEICEATTTSGAAS